MSSKRPPSSHEPAPPSSAAPSSRLGAPPSSRGLARALVDVLRDYLSEADRRAALAVCEAAAGVRPGLIESQHLPTILPYLERALGFYGVTEARKGECMGRLRALGALPPARFSATNGAPSEPLRPAATPSIAPALAHGRAAHEIVVAIEHERDIVHARVAGREVCVALGFSTSAQTKVATAISELARNIWKYAARGRVTIHALPDGSVEVVARDEGPGIANVDAVMSPNYRSRSGMGVGLQGTKRLVDHFTIVSHPGKGTTVTIRKLKE